MGGAVIYWFTGASTQAVVTGAYRAVVFIKKNLKLDRDTASLDDSKKVVEICTVYAQKGMVNIFIVVFAFALGLPFFNPYFFIGYSSASPSSACSRPSSCERRRRVGQRQENRRGGHETERHAAARRHRRRRHRGRSVQGHLLRRDESIIKFTTLFGLLAVEIAVE